jgi:hypothetical protein
MSDIALTKNELLTLEAAEEVIEKHQKTFLQVGSALMAIRDGRLYRQDYKTFEEYVSARWNWKKSRAYQLIEAASVAENVHNCGQKLPKLTAESHAREVAKAPAEKQSKVVEIATEKARSEGRKPIATDFKNAVEEIEYEDDDAEIEMPVQMTTAELAVANSEIGKRIVAAIDHAKKLLRAVEEVPGTEMLVAREKSIMHDLDNARNAVSVCVPKCVCPRCSGAGCAQCGNLGWVNSIMARELND